MSDNRLSAGEILLVVWSLLLLIGDFVLLFRDGGAVNAVTVGACALEAAFLVSVFKAENPFFRFYLGMTAVLWFCADLSAPFVEAELGSFGAGKWIAALVLILLTGAGWLLSSLVSPLIPTKPQNDRRRVMTCAALGTVVSPLLLRAIFAGMKSSAKAALGLVFYLSAYLFWQTIFFVVIKMNRRAS